MFTMMVRMDPDNAFRLVVNVSGYRYETVDMAQQHHDIWFERDSLYSLGQLHEDLATKMIWEPSQTLAIWVVEQDTGSMFRLRRDEHVQQMIKGRWNDRLAFIHIEVVSKATPVFGVNDNLDKDNGDNGSAASGVIPPVSGVTICNEAEGEANGVIPPPTTELPLAAVDWTTLIIQENPDDDGTAKQLADEDMIYEAMGFKEGEGIEEGAGQGVPIPTMSAQLRQDMNEAALVVDDTADEEPLYEWDRDNPDMSVGTCYPSIDELRLAVKQHAIRREFELITLHSDKERYRVCCGVAGCPWKLRARTQHDGSCRVYFLGFSFSCVYCTLYISKNMVSTLIC